MSDLDKEMEEVLEGSAPDEPKKRGEKGDVALKHLPIKHLNLLVRKHRLHKLSQVMHLLKQKKQSMRKKWKMFKKCLS